MYAISCLLDSNNFISLYHGSQGRLQGGILHFDKSLPSIPINQLQNETAIKFRMRPVENKDLLDDNILPVFANNKIAFLYIKSEVLIISDKSVFL